MPLSHIRLHDSAEKSKRKKSADILVSRTGLRSSKFPLKIKKLLDGIPELFPMGRVVFQLFTELAARTVTPRVIHLEFRTVSRE